ncbi:Ff.00g079440.m01.CDS01 [Fusarium sp. VM40]|nr:Ff.00g079440.m01.CDS01 [Fusarium sp. VM40]
MKASKLCAIMLPIILFYIILTIVIIMARRRWRKTAHTEGSTLERGMLVEVVRIVKDGKDIYSRKLTPDQHLYDHPSFAPLEKRMQETTELQKPESQTNEKATMSQDDFEDIPLTPVRSMKELRKELARGFDMVEKNY